MKPGDAVLVEAIVTHVPTRGEPNADIVELNVRGASVYANVEFCHALPDEATRRRLASLASDFERCAKQGDRERWWLANIVVTSSPDEMRKLAASLRLLAGNAAEDKPAAHHPEGCDCGGFDRNGSHDAGEYVGFCIAQDKPAAQSADAEGQGP